MRDAIQDSPLQDGLFEVHLPVTDLAQSIAFYAKLGFHLGFGSEADPGALLLFEAGGTRWMLGLYRVEQLSHCHPAEFHIALRVPEARVDEMIPDLQRLGIEPVHPAHAPLQGQMSEPIVHGWMRAAAVFLALCATSVADRAPDVADRVWCGSVSSATLASGWEDSRVV